MLPSILCAIFFFWLLSDALFITSFEYFNIIVPRCVCFGLVWFGLIFFAFILLGYRRFLESANVYLSLDLENFQSLFLQIFFCPTLFLLFIWDFNYMYMRFFNIFLQVLKALFIFFNFFSLSSFLDNFCWCALTFTDYFSVILILLLFLRVRLFTIGERNYK